MKGPAFAVLALVAACAAGAAPYEPRSGAEVLETLPRRADAADAALRRQRARLAEAPRDPVLAAGLAQRYVELGRAAGDPRYFGYAQAVLAPWWAAAAPPVPVLLLRATLLQSGHHFAEAMRDLNLVTAADPGNAQAWLTLATVQVVRGEYEAAVRSCGRLSSLASPLASVTCLVNARAASGQLAASERLLVLALARAGAGGEQAAALQTWALTLLGELAARRGDPAAAEARFRQALALSPGDSYLLGAYADLLLDQHRYREVQALLGEHLRIDSLLLRHTLAGQDAPSSAVAVLQARFDAAARRGDAIHQREQARFELHLRHDARAALELALANWRVQKEPADLRILLEAALAAHAPAAAAPALAWRRQHGMEDGAIAALAHQLEGGAL
ncbi:tetratricopeptide repeat protein [Pseudoduganella violaceinigra]|uniref:tetratricopeptide repeat protein n=1 Tax=Pseudoduganella violaceinigra TaxID=246602 RepID=UPI00041AC8BF|nr:tetratricopeptide repeat protein [Pseudoduganella violaceinigra]